MAKEGVGVTQPTACVVCQRRQPRTGMVCDPDRDWLGRVLAEIVELYALLPEQMAPGRAAGPRVSGSREAPLPLRVDPLDLTMPARAAGVHDVLGDQVGYLPVAAVLDSWVQDWRETIRCGDVNPCPTVPELARWLRTWLPTACDEHKAVDEFATEVFALAATLRRTCGMVDPLPEMLDAPCVRCDSVSLHRLPGRLFGEDWVECGVCGRLMTEDEYQRYVGLVVAHYRRDAA